MTEWAGDLDELPDQDAIKHLEHEFEGWHCFRSCNNLCYAQARSQSPPVTVRGEDWTDLRDMITREVGQACGQPAPAP